MTDFSIVSPSITHNVLTSKAALIDLGDKRESHIPLRRFSPSCLRQTPATMPVEVAGDEVVRLLCDTTIDENGFARISTCLKCGTPRI